MADVPENAVPATQLLPYASGIHLPAAEGEGDARACCRAGELLVAYNGATLPARCILCGGESAHAPIKLGFTWDSSFRVTRVASLQLRQSAHIHAYLCVAHRARWTAARRVGFIAIVVSLAVILLGMALAIASESSAVPRWTPLAIGLMVGGFGSVTVALFYFTLCSRTLSCAKIQEGYLYLEGASPEFLRQVPPARDDI